MCRLDAGRRKGEGERRRMVRSLSVQAYTDWCVGGLVVVLNTYTHTVLLTAAAACIATICLLTASKYLSGGELTRAFCKCVYF